MRILLANFSKMVGDSGGLAKVNVAFANEMVRRGHTVTTVYSDDREGDFFYPLDTRVMAYNLRHFRGQTQLFPISYKIRREVLRALSERRGRAVNLEFVEKYLLPHVRTILTETKPDVIVCFQQATTKSYVCDIGTSIPVISMSHGPTADYFTDYPTEELPALQRADVCQVLLEPFAEPLREHLTPPPKRIEVIGNVVPQYVQQADLAREKAVYKVVFVGRLARKHKQPHLAIEAFAKIADQFSNWRLELWGAEDNGNYYRKLRRMVQQVNRSGRERIKLCGSTKDIPAVLQCSDLCVAPSAFEGFSLAHTEAMSMGLPLIGFRSCVSLSAIIRDGESGLLAADGADALAEKMAVLMRDRNLREKMGAAARESMRVYAPEIIWGRWEALMEEVIASRQGHHT